MQVGDGNFLSVNLLFKALGGRVTVHGSQERRGSRRCSSGTEKITPTRIAQLFHTRRAREASAPLWCRSSRLWLPGLANSGPQKIHTAHKFYCKETENRAEKPQAY